MQPLANYSRFILNKTGVLISVLIILIFTFWSFGPSSTQAVDSIKGLAPTTTTNTPRHQWPGWTGIKHMVVFGDSYSATGFKANGEQPSEQNPLGNPEWPGSTSTNGPNWVDFLTLNYNQTFLKTLNFAYGGATVDGDLIRQFMGMIHSFKTQVYEDYLPNYCPPPANFNWKPEDTLFATFFGINDVNNAYQDSTASWVLDQDIAEYADLVDVVYQSGARNFLFMKVPPFDRSPLVIGHGEKAVSEECDLINEFNANITKMAANFTSTYHDVTTFVFDTHSIYSQVLDDPCSHEESCALKNLTGVCPAYGEPPTDMFKSAEECSFPVDEYFWMNPLHPTFRIHNVTAKAVAAELVGRTLLTPDIVDAPSSVMPQPSDQPYRR